MSTQTKAGLDAAIAAHVADEQSAAGIVTGYAFIASSATAAQLTEETTAYMAEYADLQPFHVGLGLAHRLVLMLERQANDE